MRKYIKLFEEYSKSASYSRVIPRDFFNESKLLKCMGFLALNVLNGTLPEGIVITVEEREEPFDIIHDLEWNMLIVKNYPVTINDEIYTVGTTYNSKENFPFYLITQDNSEIEIFDDNGKFSTDFIEYFTNEQ